MEALHSRVRIVWFANVLLIAAVLGAIAAGIEYYALDVGLWLVGAVVGLVAVFSVGYVIARYRIWGFAVSDEDLYIDRGVVTRINSVVPYVRVQHVDTQRSPIERLVGLSSVVVYTAGSRGADITIPGLAPERAEELRERLRRLAIDSESGDAV